MIFLTKSQKAIFILHTQSFTQSPLEKIHNKNLSTHPFSPFRSLDWTTLTPIRKWVFFLCETSYKKENIIFLFIKTKQNKNYQLTSAQNELFNARRFTADNKSYLLKEKWKNLDSWKCSGPKTSNYPPTLWVCSIKVEDVRSKENRK